MPLTNGPPLRTTVTVIAGQTSVPVVHLPWGRSVGPLAVGSLGDWAIFGEGVLGVHLLLSFDGQQLHVAPAKALNYVAVNGQVLDQRWWAVPVHSEIQFGSVVLRVGCEEVVDQPGDSTQEDPMTSTVPDGGRLRRYAEGLLGPPGTAEASPDASAPQQSQSLPAAPRAFSAPPAHSGALATPRPAAGSPPPERPPSAWPNAEPARGFAASWRGTSWPMKLTLFLLPVAAAGILYTWDDPPESPEPARDAPPRASAKARAPAPPAASLAELAPTAGPPASPSSTPAPVPNASVITIGAASATPSASAAPRSPSSATAPRSSAAPLRSTVPPAAPAGANIARPALEAAFAGQLGVARLLYERLAEQHPEQPVFRAAADHVKAGTVRKP